MAAKKKSATKPSATKKSSSKKSAGSRSKVAKVMEEFKHGELKSGGRRKVRNPKQAIAIALNEARESGENVPPPKKKSPAKKSAARKTQAKKSAAKKKS